MGLETISLAFSKTVLDLLLAFSDHYFVLIGHSNYWLSFTYLDQISLFSPALLLFFVGICVRGNPPSNYARHGPSQQCFVGNSSIACPNGSKLCSGLNSEANYVYKVTLPGGCKMSLEFPSVYDVILFRVCFCKLYISYLQYYFFSFFRVQLLLFCCITIRDDRVKYSKLHYFAVLVTLKTILFTCLKKISNL